MDLDEHTGVEDNLAKTCAVCGATLSESEIEVSREAGGLFLCATHANEEVPVFDDPAPAE